MKNKLIAIPLLLIISLCGCSLNNAHFNQTSTSEFGEEQETHAINQDTESSENIETYTEYQTDKSPENSDTKTEVAVIPPSTSKMEVNHFPEIGEKFVISHLAKSGNLYMTVNYAKCYTNISNSIIDTEKFTERYYYNDEIINKETGEIYPSAVDGTEYYFILVNVTIENENAISDENESLLPVYQGLDPELFPDKYCDEFDFSATDFFCTVNHTTGANDLNNLGGSLDYFSLMNELYDDNYRKYLYKVAPGESITFDIGSFVPKSNSNEDLVAQYGGALNEDLISRIVLCTSSSTLTPIVELHLG